MWNPLYLIRACIGKQMLTELLCALSLISAVLIMAYVVPPVYDEVKIAEALPWHIGYYALYAAGLVVLAIVSFVCVKCCCTCGKKDEGDDDDDDEGGGGDDSPV